MNYYESQYRIDHNGTDEVTEGVLAIERRRATRILPIITKRKKSVVSALDVGSSTGELLYRIKQQYGCSVVGVEPCTKFRKYANDRGVFTVQHFPASNVKFDLITCIHTLEHLDQPGKTLCDLHFLAGADCLLVIEVPYMDSGHGHVTQFTSHSLASLVMGSGWRIEQVTSDKKKITLEAF